VEAPITVVPFIENMTGTPAASNALYPGTTPSGNGTTLDGDARIGRSGVGGDRRSIDGSVAGVGGGGDVDAMPRTADAVRNER
jgi:hypothetical protein